MVEISKNGTHLEVLDIILINNGHRNHDNGNYVDLVFLNVVIIIAFYCNSKHRGHAH